MLNGSHVSFAGQQKPVPQSTGKPGGHVDPQLVPSALQKLPDGQHVLWQDTGNPDGQQSPGFTVLHVSPAGQQTPVPQSTGKPGGHDAPQVLPSALQKLPAAQHVF